MLYLLRDRPWQRAAPVSPARIPISKTYLLTYPDGSKKHVSRAERDELLLSGLAKQTASDRYLFTGQCRTLHSLSELSALNLCVESQNLRRFLPGSFVVELRDKRRRERLETSEQCAIELSHGRYQSRAIGEFRSTDSGASEATN